MEENDYSNTDLMIALSLSDWIIVFGSHKLTYFINSVEAESWWLAFEVVPSAQNKKNMTHRCHFFSPSRALVAHMLGSRFGCWQKTKKVEKLITARLAFQLHFLFLGGGSKKVFLQNEINISVSLCAFMPQWRLLWSHRVMRQHKSEMNGRCTFLNSVFLYCLGTFFFFF